MQAMNESYTLDVVCSVAKAVELRPLVQLDGRGTMCQRSAVQRRNVLYVSLYVL